MKRFIPVFAVFPLLCSLAFSQPNPEPAVPLRWSRPRANSSPSRIDWSDVPETKKTYAAADVGKRASSMIASHTLHVMFVHFGDVDRIGHAIGWGTPEQFSDVEQVDTALSVVLDTLRQSGNYDKTLIIVSADHGGFARTHGTDDERAANISWIATGPGIRRTTTSPA